MASPPSGLLTGAPGALPDAGLWQRVVDQVVVRLGVFPGDRVLVLAPGGHEVSRRFAARHPRTLWLTMDPRDGWLGAAAQEGSGAGANASGQAMVPTGRPEQDAAVHGMRGHPLHLPIKPGAIDAVFLALGATLWRTEIHDAFCEGLAEVLPPFGKWYELIACHGPKDPVLGAARAHLRAAGFEKVHVTRLGLGRMGAAMFLVSGRATGGPECDDELDADSEE